MKKIFLLVNIVILLCGLHSAQVSAANFLQFTQAGQAANGRFDSLFKANTSAGFSIKKEAYEESKDPLYRRGTQNTDTPQGMFFALPIALTVVFFIVLFAKKK